MNNSYNTDGRTNHRPSELELYALTWKSLRENAAGPVNVALEGHVPVTEYVGDIVVFERRLSSEGLCFLTKTLPSLGKAIDSALLGNSDAFTTLPFKRNGSKIPLFLGGLLRLVFTDDGCVRSDACTQSLRLLRQLCFLFYKLEVPYAEETVALTLQSFLDTDASLPTSFSYEAEDIAAGSPATSSQERTHEHLQGDFDPLESVLPARLGYASFIAKHIIHTVLSNADPRDISGRHGPGAVATGERGSEKVVFSRLYARLDAFYPFCGYFEYNLSHTFDSSTYGQLEALEELKVGTAKVVLVPKDSRGPRLISCEPLEYQWIQQGQMSLLTETIESARFTRGHVNFRDQTVNQKLAVEGSITTALATLDMKDASDRVSLALVNELFPTLWVDALAASRTSSTKLPNGEIVQLKKFAPMGSAVCFPVEALCFFALSVAAVYCKHIALRDGSLALTLGKPRIDTALLRRVAESIYVYGDDVVCRTEDCGTVITTLEAFALRVNVNKCCMKGSFRESCGVDAFKGVNVSPLRLKRRWSSSLMGPDAYLSYVAFSNELFERGYVEAAKVVELSVQARRPTPYTSHKTPSGVMFIRPHEGYHSTPVKGRTRFNTDLQRLEILCRYPVPDKELSENSGWKELLRCEAGRSLDPTPTIPSGDRGIVAGCYAVPRSYKLKRGWMPYVR